jgi:hypothetical protein
MTVTIDTRDPPAGRGKANDGAETNTLRRCIMLWRRVAATVDENGHRKLNVALWALVQTVCAFTLGPSDDVEAGLWLGSWDWLTCLWGATLTVRSSSCA